jgi:nitrite reductase/ring-hydroxylating ferredoxin subunit/uncharacterized membrane protein
MSVGTRDPKGTAVKPLARETIADRIEHLDGLDAFAEPLQAAVRNVVPPESQLKDLLSGTWLGHPFHPPLTDVVIGAWTSALLLDLVGGEHGEEAADRLVAAGILAAVPTASAGLSDWADVRGGSRRVGLVHALGNTSALLLQTASWVARRRGQRRRGRTLSAVGFGIASFSAWLGGHLSFAEGVGVNQTAFEDAPADWTPVIADAQLPDGTPTAARASALEVVLIRKGDSLHALADRCSHRGCALHDGSLNPDGTLTCRCHGSTFRLDGSIVKGPATSPQPAYDLRVRDGQVELRRRGG